MVYNNVSTALSRGPGRDDVVVVDNASRYLSGFNVYRMGPGETEYSFLETVPYEDGVTEYSYYDEDPYPGSYPYDVYYRLSATWESDTDCCESPWALDASFPLNDYVHILITGLEDQYAEAVTNLYPNPATDLVNVTSSQAMTHITVINYVGQVVYDAELGNTLSAELNTSSYESGVYVVQIDTENGVITKRVTIAR